ncbi:MAG: hypothetical protein EOL87_14260 [Spartobacteria bacterium]|nr:hypothetical protein [Spartobacteria bacterium]
MITFGHAIDEAMRLGYISPQVVARLPGTPIYIHHHGKQEISAPSVEAWKGYRFLDQFQKVLPSPITRTVQTSDGLLNFTVSSILVSDGDNLVAFKFMTKEDRCLLIVQNAQISSLIDKLRVPGQNIQVNNRGFSISPVPNEIPIQAEPMHKIVKILWITTLHFIYSICEETDSYGLG